MIRTRLISSLEKVFCDEPLKAQEHCSGSALKGEVFAFQLAYWADDFGFAFVPEVESELKELIEVREVLSIPSEVPALDWEMPEAVLRSTGGLFPDLLRSRRGGVRAVINQWRALWITVRIPEDYQAGCYDIKITLRPAKPDSATGELIADAEAYSTETFQLKIADAVLPPSELIHTEWFHTDCIYTQYNVECWSEEHWALLEKYFRSAAEHGINMLLTPLWTPPLDTAVGTYRPTTQLLDISFDGKNYSFDFSKLERWLNLARKCGFVYFEMSHCYAQWGVKTAPQIVVKNPEGVVERRFGWDVPAMSEEYMDFMRQLFPPLLKLLAGLGLEGKCYFHISDEPTEEFLENYRAASTFVKELLQGGDWPVLDALSSVEFYRHGLVQNPVPSNDHIEAFVAEGVNPLWTYYCIGQRGSVPNRFFTFPSARNRIMGIMMYLYNVKGFLQWGFNFWYSQFSLDRKQDVYFQPDAGRCFCGGDSFLVYPGEDGPEDSIRYEVLREGLQDLQALQLLEKKMGREAVVALIHENVGYKLTMKRYPRSAQWLLDLRERINASLTA